MSPDEAKSDFEDKINTKVFRFFLIALCVMVGVFVLYIAALKKFIKLQKKIEV